MVGPYRGKLPESAIRNMEEQLSGLEDKKGVYKQAVDTLDDDSLTMLVLVARPESRICMSLCINDSISSRLNIMIVVGSSATTSHGYIRLAENEVSGEHAVNADEARNGCPVGAIEMERSGIEVPGEILGVT